MPSMEAIASRVIHRHVDLACEPSVAFAHFTRPELLEAWLTAKAVVEPEVGGKFELFWDPATPTANSTLGCRVTALVREQLLAFDWRGPVQFAPFMNAADPLTHVTVSFHPLPEGGTRVNLVHAGWRQGTEWEEARAWFEGVWANAFSELLTLIG